MSRALLAGWFSFEGMGATAGDLMAKDVCAAWLDAQGWECEVALAHPFEGGVDWRAVDPQRYDVVVFVCGPFGNGWPVSDFLARFGNARLVGLDLTMLDPVESWNPFDVLIERDSSRVTRPDISILSTAPLVPLVGVVLVHAQKEYAGGLHLQANNAIERLLEGRDVARVAIDTRLDVNGTGLHSARQVESLIARMDVVVTTRLHGTVLALKHAVPVVVIDPIAGGRKVVQQARSIGWSRAFAVDQVNDAILSEAFDYCLSAAGRDEAKRVRDVAMAGASEIEALFVDALAVRAGDSLAGRTADSTVSGEAGQS